VEPNGNVGTVRTGVREAPSLISDSAGDERLEERLVVIPAPHVMQLHVQSAQRRDGLLPIRLKLSQELAPEFSDDFTEAGQLRIPGARI